MLLCQVCPDYHVLCKTVNVRVLASWRHLCRCKAHGPAGLLNFWDQVSRTIHLYLGPVQCFSVKQQTKAVTVHSVERMSSKQISLHCISTSKRYYAFYSLKQWESSSSAGFTSPTAVLLSQTEPRASNRHLATFYCT